MSPSPRPPRWVERAVPLAAGAVVAEGSAASVLVRRLLAEPALRPLRGVRATIADGSFLVLLGSSGDLPWVDGVRYFGVDPEAPGLFLPTTLAPIPSAALLLRALGRLGLEPPLLLLAPGGGAVPLGAARPIERKTLEAHS